MRGSMIGFSAILTIVTGATQADASTHRKHGSEHHHATTRQAVHARHEDRKHDNRKPASTSGAIAIPASGIKLACGPRKSPLMVRKMTQGSGTIVTVICR